MFAGTRHIFGAGPVLIHVLRRGARHIHLVLRSAGTGAGCSRGRSRFCGAFSLPAALDLDREARDHAGYGSDGGKHGGGYYAEGRHRERNLHEGIAVLILDNDAADVAFMDELFDLLAEVLAVNFELLEKTLEPLHIQIIGQVVRAQMQSVANPGKMSWDFHRRDAEPGREDQLNRTLSSSRFLRSRMTFQFVRKNANSEAAEEAEGAEDLALESPCPGASAVHSRWPGRGFLVPALKHFAEFRLFLLLGAGAFREGLPTRFQFALLL